MTTPDTTAQPRDAAGRPTDHSPAAIRARYDAASDHVAALCQGERWTLRIPAQPGRDSDLVISDALDDIPRLLARIQAVVDLHKPAIPHEAGEQVWCNCGVSYPCPTRRALEGE